ncbi:WUSCHEL-related homeobox 6-like [Vigna umbellata]|nr:WUSCHEL-related homeobox 6-like [Vigna umbellata]
MDIKAKTVYKRWRSTPEQVNILLNIFNHGIINPSRDQIREITERLKEYGEVGEYSVYCWFQNHGNRVKHRRLPQDVPGTSEPSYSLLPSFMYAMASQAFSVNFFLVALIAALFFAVATAEELSPAPAPGPDAGAGASVSSSMAVIGASIVVSMFAILKQ